MEEQRFLVFIKLLAQDTEEPGIEGAGLDLPFKIECLFEKNVFFEFISIT